jgi:hypothetical protein
MALLLFHQTIIELLVQPYLVLVPPGFHCWISQKRPMTGHFKQYWRILNHIELPTMKIFLITSNDLPIYVMTIIPDYPRLSLEIANISLWTYVLVLSPADCSPAARPCGATAGGGTAALRRCHWGLAGAACRLPLQARRIVGWLLYVVRTK